MSESELDEQGATNIEALRSENALLRARLAELMQERGSGLAPKGAEDARDVKDWQQSHSLLQAILDNSASVIFVKDVEGRYILINKRCEAFMHTTNEAMRGKTDYAWFPPDIAEQVRKHDQYIMETGLSTQMEERVPMQDGSGMSYHISAKFPIRDAAGTIMAVGGITTDITTLKRTEEERAALQAQVIDAHRAALRELSTPLIPLAEGVLVMPIIGTLDSSRAAQLMETLLRGVNANGARVVILDVTGVKVVDTQVANALLQSARAVRLLGAEVVLTGIGPHVATTLIGLGVDLGNLTTLGTLRAGVSYALKRGR